MPEIFKTNAIEFIKGPVVIVVYFNILFEFSHCSLRRLPAAVHCRRRLFAMRTFVTIYHDHINNTVLKRNEKSDYIIIDT